jgi:hypothetical protein
MKTFFITCIFAGIIFTACTNNNSENQEPQVNKEEKIKSELKAIDSLLQNKQFAEAMAMELEAAYYKGVGEPVPPFLKPGEDSLQIDRSVKEEKIATNLAGFYALECGLNYLCSRDSRTPVQWIEQILADKAGDSITLLLNRFANATWKAGQPFRGLERITRYNFTSASSLTAEEIAKDLRQIKNAAIVLQKKLKPGTKDKQLEQVRTLLRDKDFAMHIASQMDSAYYAGENKPASPFLSAEEIKAVKKKSFKEEKIATNLARFLATETATNYLVTIKHEPPSFFLQALVDNTLPAGEKFIYARFANATWKAGQPFRGLDRITRETFTPFNFLTEADIEKDLVQVRAAAKKMLEELKQN